MSSPTRSCVTIARTTILSSATPRRNSPRSPSRTSPVSSVGLNSSASAVPYLAVWSESAAPDTFERIAGLVDRLARRLEQALGAEDAAIATAA
jgi:hypothetical protein